MASRFQRTSQGAIGGAAAAAPTGNPWAIGGGALLGGALGFFSEEPGLTQDEIMNNQLTLEGMQLSNRQMRGQLRSAKRIEKEQKAKQRKKRSIGRLMSPYFKNLRR